MDGPSDLQVRRDNAVCDTFCRVGSFYTVAVLESKNPRCWGQTRDYPPTVMVLKCEKKLMNFYDLVFLPVFYELNGVTHL